MILANLDRLIICLSYLWLEGAGSLLYWCCAKWLWVFFCETWENLQWDNFLFFQVASVLFNQGITPVHDHVDKKIVAGVLIVVISCRVSYEKCVVACPTSLGTENSHNFKERIPDSDKTMLKPNEKGCLFRSVQDKLCVSHHLHVCFWWKFEDKI